MLGRLTAGRCVLPKQCFSCFIDNAGELPLNVAVRNLFEECASSTAREQDHPRRKQSHIPLAMLSIDSILLAQSLVKASCERNKIDGSCTLSEFDKQQVPRLGRSFHPHVSSCSEIHGT
jgi:hypothetical protein